MPTCLSLMTISSRLQIQASARIFLSVSTARLSIRNRSLELVGKLALLYAISEGIMSPNKMEITPKAVKWAWKLVKSCQLRMVSMVEEYSAVDEMDDKLRKVERIIRQAGKRGISRKEFYYEKT